MSSPQDTRAFLGGLRASVTIADEFFRIIFMNDLAIKHYAYGGGQALVGTDLLDCHNAESQAMLHDMYARYRAGDLTPTRYHEDKGDGLARSILFLPLVIDSQFRGVVELIWHERADLVLDL